MTDTQKVSWVCLMIAALFALAARLGRVDHASAAVFTLMAMTLALGVQLAAVGRIVWRLVNGLLLAKRGSIVGQKHSFQEGQGIDDAHSRQRKSE